MDAKNNGQNTEKKINFSIWYLIIGILVMLLIRSIFFGGLCDESSEISYSKSKTALRVGKVKSVTV